MSLLLISCSNNIPIGSKIYKVNNIKNINSKTYCEYEISTAYDYINIDNNITITDSIGKFKINDTVCFTLNK